MCLSPVTSCHNFSSLISVMVGLRGPSCNLSDKPLLKVSKMSRNLALQEQQFGPENFRVTFLISFVVLVLFCFWHFATLRTRFLRWDWASLIILPVITVHKLMTTKQHLSSGFPLFTKFQSITQEKACMLIDGHHFWHFIWTKKILDRLASKNVTQLTQKPVFDVYAFGTCFFFKVYICQHV